MFDPSKGFGFVVAEGHSGDILLHSNILRNFGQSSVADGVGIKAKVSKAQSGWQVVEIVSIDMPEVVTVTMAEDRLMLLATELTALPAEPARVKWFDKSKGFGFANVFGRPGDVFIHIEVLKASGFAGIANGEAVALRIVEGKRGKIAVQVLSWEAALSQTKSEPVAVAAK